MSKYKITYHHDAQEITQEKFLVEHKFYIIYKACKSILDNKKAEKEDIIKAKERLKDFPENFFTDCSPLCEAMSTGVLEHHGGTTKVTFQLCT